VLRGEVDGKAGIGIGDDPDLAHKYLLLRLDGLIDYTHVNYEIET
jgi:hypothetical protein